MTDSASNQSSTNPVTPLQQSLADAMGKLAKATPGGWEDHGDCVIHDSRQLVCCGRGHGECCGSPEVEGEQLPIVGLLGGNDNAADIATIAAAVNLLKTHGAEIEAAVKDAERLNYLSAWADNITATGPNPRFNWRATPRMPYGTPDPSLRESIDAAIACGRDG